MWRPPLRTFPRALKQWGCGSLSASGRRPTSSTCACGCRSIVIFVIVYGRMIEIYLTVSLAPIPFSTMANREWGQMGTGVPPFPLCAGVPGIFDPGLRRHLCGVLVQSIPASGDIHGAIWGTAGYTVLLAFALFKTGSLSKSIFNAR